MDRSPSRLMVIIADRLSQLISKGELTERYYNPGDLFDEVHLLLTNDDCVEAADVQKTAGRARLFIHNLPSPSFKRTLGWQRPLLRPWLSAGCAIAGTIRPHLVRTHNNFLEGYLASEIARRLAVPYVVSLHGVWDRDCLGSPGERFRRLFRIKLEKQALHDAAAVIAVYRPILRYAEALGARNVHLIYNAVSGSHIVSREHYGLSSPPRLITVNRQVPEKNPEQIIRAVKDLECCYTIVGDGELHQHLQQVARREGCADRLEFVRSIDNERLCRMLKDYDIMVSHCDYWGISKSLIEAALAGLPILVNRHPDVEDLRGGWLLQCDNSPEGYAAILKELFQSEEKRTQAGTSAREYALRNFDPRVMEGRVAELYRSVSLPW